MGDTAHTKVARHLEGKNEAKKGVEQGQPRHEFVLRAARASKVFKMLL